MGKKQRLGTLEDVGKRQKCSLQDVIRNGRQISTIIKLCFLWMMGADSPDQGILEISSPREFLSHKGPLFKNEKEEGSFMNMAYHLGDV